MSEILTLAEDPVARAKFADIIAAQQLTEQELAFLVPDDFTEDAFEPLPWIAGLGETMFMSKLMRQAQPPQDHLENFQKKRLDYVNKAPAEYTSHRYTTERMLKKLGL